MTIDLSLSFQAEAKKKIEETGGNLDKLVGLVKKGKFMLGDKVCFLIPIIPTC